MKIYFAGVPGGVQKDRERELFLRFPGLKRLISYHYIEAGMVTINEGLLYQERYRSNKKDSE